MTYNPNIPQASDIISQSQAQLLTNFQQADLIFDVDHVTFDNATVADRGKHRKADFIRLGADPGSAATQLVVYEKLSGTSSELFFQRDNVATVTQLTGGGITAAAWVHFENGNPPINVRSFNVTSVVFNSTGNYTVNFTRNFTDTFYVAIINGYQTGTGDTVNRKINISSKLVSSITFNVTVPGTGADQVPLYDLVFFGTLA